MKVILTGGGTGGHVNPALAIGAAVEAYEPSSQIYYVGTPKGIENKLVPEKYPMYHVDIRGLRRSLSPSNFKTLYLTITSRFKARKLLRELQPDLVVGTGGYVCWPLVQAAADLKIPCALHESNAVPGFAVKMLEKQADIIFVNFEKTAELLPRAKKVMHLGTPVRPEFYTANRLQERRKLDSDGNYQHVLVSFGGSLGAARVNAEILELMEHYGAKHPELLHIHAAGGRSYEEVKTAFQAKGLDRYENLVLVDYLYDMPGKMAAADLVICRSGAMTLSELAVLKKPSILIPSPNVTNDQQTKNARLLSDVGAAVLLKEEQLTENRLQREVEALLADPVTLAEMSRKVAAFAVQDSERKLYETLSALVTEKNSVKLG